MAVLQVEGSVDVKQFGAVGDGITDDAPSLLAAYNYHAKSALKMVLENKVYLVRPSEMDTIIGGNQVKVLFPIQDNTNILGNGATIKLADNESTDASPVDISMFYSKGHNVNFFVDSLNFDLNSANNPISPLRPTTYNKIKHAVIWFEDLDARCDGLIYQNSSVKNANGVNVIVTGRVSVGVSSLLGKRHLFSNLTFENCGGDTDDHSTIYTWAEDTVVDQCSFNNPALLPSVPSAFELHASNSRFTGCVVRGFYQRGGYLAGNYTSDTKGLNVSDNAFYVTSSGASLFRNTSQLNVTDVTFNNNLVVLDDQEPSNPNNWKFGFNCSADVGISNINVFDNIIEFTDTTRNNYGVRVRGATEGGEITHVSILNNKITQALKGVYVAASGAADELGYVVVDGNEIINCTGAAGVAGVQVSGNASSSINSVVVINNKITDDRSVSETTDAILITSVVDILTLEGNQYVNTISGLRYQNAIIQQYLGRQARDFAGSPSVGTWEVGDQTFNTNPVEFGGAGSAYVIQGWVCTVAGTPGTHLQLRALTGN